VIDVSLHSFLLVSCYRPARCGCFSCALAPHMLPTSQTPKRPTTTHTTSTLAYVLQRLLVTRAHSSHAPHLNTSGTDDCACMPHDRPRPCCPNAAATHMLKQPRCARQAIAHDLARRCASLLPKPPGCQSMKARIKPKICLLLLKAVLCPRPSPGQDQNCTLTVLLYPGHHLAPAQKCSVSLCP